MSWSRRGLNPRPNRLWCPRFHLAVYARQRPVESMSAPKGTTGKPYGAESVAFTSSHKHGITTPICRNILFTRPFVQIDRKVFALRRENRGPVTVTDDTRLADFAMPSATGVMKHVFKKLLRRLWSFVFPHRSGGGLVGSRGSRTVCKK